MTIAFFPRQKGFWIYHGLVLIAYTVAHVFLWIFFRQDIYSQFINQAVWVVLFTAAILFFRKQYKQRSLWKITTNKLIPLVFIYAALSGISINIIITLLYPFFDAKHIDDMLKNNPGVTHLALSTSFVIGQTLGAQTLISAWIFIYISITTNRRAKESELANLHLQNNLKEAQLKSLANQLNPHFLFNSLNNIRFMIHENAQTADKMITSLSDVLRYSLESGCQEKVLLRQEIEIIERYISIVKAQLEDRLHFSIDIPQQFYRLHVPPMALQMLVENAIKHGLENIQRGGSLTLEAFEKGDQLIFTVTNDIPKTIKIISHGMSIGLKNIEQRLHLLYGIKASLNIVKTDTKFVVTVTLPKEIAK